jgi:hypothetical protein
MITLELHQAHSDLPALAEKALGGEDMFITIGARRSRLVPVGPDAPDGDTGPRPGRGALRGLLTIPDAFYEPWTDEEMGE